MEKPIAKGENTFNPKSFGRDCPKSTKEMRKMKFYRKVNLIQGKYSIKGGLKKNYCLNTLSLDTSIEKPNFIKRLLHSRKFSNLDLISGETYDEVTFIINSFGKYLNGLKHLTLTLGVFCYKKRETRIQNFVRQIGKNTKNLQHLDLEFTYWDDLTNEEAQVLVKYIDHNLKSLRSLSLSFNDCGEVTCDGLHLAMRLGTSLPSLQELTIRLSSNFYHSTTELQDFIQRIGVNLPKLQSLGLDFSDCDTFVNKAAQSLTKQMGNSLKRLKRLHLALPDCQEISDEAIEQVAKNLMTQLINLESLNLDVARMATLTDRGIISLAEQIQNLKGLKQLHLSFKNCHNITDAGTKVLAIEIQTHLNLLKDFSLVTNCLSAFARPETITDLATLF